ncbi:MAG TPA: hypothetical protein VFA59_04870, partial [Vicinamibacterales bacterium]|nr:hypothetical protein [Vicinamibacterales bacterium]
LATGEPWHARDALDVLTSLDMTAWAGLLALLDEFPVLHGAVTALTGSSSGRVHPSAFQFISSDAQLAQINTFLDALPTILAAD